MFFCILEILLRKVEDALQMTGLCYQWHSKIAGKVIEVQCI